MPSIPIVDDALSDFLARWRNHLKTAHEFGRVHAAQHVTTLLEFLTVAEVEATLTAALSVSGETIQQIIHNPRPRELRTNPVVALRRFFDFAILEGLISTSPMPDTKGTGPGSKTGIVTADIEEFLEKWEGWLFAQYRLTVERRASDKRKIRLLVAATGPRSLFQLLDLGTPEVELYLDGLPGQLSHKRQTWLAISRIFDFAIEQRQIQENPASGIEVTGAQPRPKPADVLSVEQMARTFEVLEARDVADWIKARDLCFVSLLYRPRLLGKEAIQVTLGDIGKQLRVRTAGGGLRFVDLDQRSSAYLDRYLASIPFRLKDDEPIFRSSDGGRFRTNSLAVSGKRLKLNLNPSVLRRSASVHFHDELGGQIGLRVQAGNRKLVGVITDDPPSGMFEEYRRVHPRNVPA